jgi:hypothetical protein
VVLDFTLPVGGAYLRAGDVDLDGRPELVSSDGSANVAAHRLAGTLRFDSSAFALGDDVRDLAVADVNGDGRADVLVLSAAGVFPLLSRAP